MGGTPVKSIRESPYQRKRLPEVKILIYKAYYPIICYFHPSGSNYPELCFNQVGPN